MVVTKHSVPIPSDHDLQDEELSLIKAHCQKRQGISCIHLVVLHNIYNGSVLDYLV